MHRTAAVIPSMRDVVGAPVPGVSGVQPRPTPPRADFERVLRELRLRPTTTGVGTRGGTTPTQRLQPTTGAAQGTTAVRRTTGATLPSSMGTAPSAAGAGTSRGPLVLPRFTGTPVVPRTTTPAPAATPASPTTPTTPGRVRPLQGAARQELIDTIHAVSRDAGVDGTVSVGIARAESSLDPTAVSPDGQSVGTFQMTHGTRAEMHRKIARGDVDAVDGPEEVALPVGYLRYLDGLFSDDTTLARGLATTGVDDPAERQLFTIAAYNAGEGRVAQAQARAEAAGLDPTRFAQVRPFLPPITQTYVGRVTRYAAEEASAVAAATRQTAAA